ncbi:MAG TPA: hypothetical protein VHW01_17770 [Polyangiaceae bacterium]|nr:hypothetical protein [Polyangiaceae bacterium]
MTATQLSPIFVQVTSDLLPHNGLIPGLVRAVLAKPEPVQFRMLLHAGAAPS